ncbi:MAG: hypothetical protein PHX86_02205 [Caldisericia bacterium]|nr:hypothetical protein [Caldisericia bacterium]
MIHKEYLDRHEVVSLKEWIVSYLLLSIPIIGIFFAIYWAFSGQTKMSKQTWAQCVLLFFAFFILILLIAEIGFSFSIFTSLGNLF